jgi:hypothetical protein
MQGAGAELDAAKTAAFRHAGQVPGMAGVLVLIGALHCAKKET